MKSTLITFRIILIALVSSINAYRILGIFTMIAKSHFLFNEAILESMHAAGHEITMISPFPSEKKIENFTYVDSRFDDFVLVGRFPVEGNLDLSLGHMISEITALEISYCRNVIKLKEIQEALNSTKKLYDVILVELFVAYECYFPIAEKLGIPIIGTVTMHSWKLADCTIGVPNNPAIIPMDYTKTTNVKMNFIERLKNLWNYLVVDNNFQTTTRNVIDKFYADYFDEELWYKKDVSLILVNNHASLFPRSTIPNAVEIGGIHLVPAKPLPEEFQKFIDEAPRGVILFTLGSLINTSSMSLQKRQAFLDAFASVPQRVIWKYEEPIENLPKNIMISSWLPQRDILEHKNVIAFMSHCGQNGVYEAVVTATPVVTVPIISDQHSNAYLLQERGVGVHLDFKTVTKEKVLFALNTLINDTSYQKRMQELSSAFNDRPMTPQELVVYWTEYVIRHNGTSYLKPYGTDMPLYKYLMLDIIAALSIAACVTILVFYLIGRNAYTIVVKKQKYEIPPKKDN